MQKYRLKQWYPNLHLAWSITDSYEYDRESNRMHNRTRWGTIPITAPYLHPDFWELIEEKRPLFVTEDGVNLFDLCQTVYLIHPKTFMKQKSDLGYFSTNDLDNNKLFYHESNADEYVWKNKRVFNYEDMMKAKHSIFLTNEDIEKSAKERS